MATTTATIASPTTKSSQPKCSDFRRILTGLAPIAVLYILYSIVRWSVSDRGPGSAIRHGRDVLRLERWLDIDVEVDMQHQVLKHLWLTRSVNWYYVYGFLPILISCTLLGVWKAPAAFYKWRRIFSISMIMALIGFASFPVAPPRLLDPSYEFVDTLLKFGPHYYGDSTGGSLFNLYGRIPSTVNVYAAMPSMHVAWSVVAGALFCAVVGARWWSMSLAVLHPILMGFAVIATGNHFLLDVIAGLVVLLLAIWLTRYWPHSRSIGGEPSAAPV
jgi:membrane-associated phospholipid phosphatase